MNNVKGKILTLTVNDLKTLDIKGIFDRHDVIEVCINDKRKVVVGKLKESKKFNFLKFDKYGQLYFVRYSNGNKETMAQDLSYSEMINDLYYNIEKDDV